MQADVGVDDADQRHIRKIQPFGDHLRAEQDVNEASPKRRQHAGMAARLAHRVAVHAAHDVAGEALLDLGLQFLRAQSLVAHRRLPAQRAAFLRLLLVATVMAEHDVALFVVRQRQVAKAARLDVAARRAMHVRREAAAVEQQHHLAAVLERRSHGVLESVAQRRRPAAPRRLMAQIDQPHLRQGSIEHALRQLQERVLACARHCASFPATGWPSRG